jgi:hypothetical protein
MKIPNIGIICLSLIIGLQILLSPVMVNTASADTARCEVVKGVCTLGPCTDGRTPSSPCDEGEGMCCIVPGGGGGGGGGGDGAGGFVPCDGTDCSACHLAIMANTIIKWLIGILFLIFAGLMFVAGFGLITSAGNVSAKEAAKSKFTNAIIGILIVLASWLIVDTIMKAMLKGDPGDEKTVGHIEGYGPWSQITCYEQREPKLVRLESYGDLSTSAPDDCDGTDCSALEEACKEDGGTPHIDTDSIPYKLRCDRPIGGDAPGACDESQMSNINLFGFKTMVSNDIKSKLETIHNEWTARGGNSWYRVYSVGAYSCRKVTGGSNYSIHAYGLAVDINPKDNGYKKPKVNPCPTNMPPEFVNMFKSKGFGWGGEWNSLCDAMHFSGASKEGGWIDI